MAEQNLLDELAALPADARRQVADFIAFLRQRHGSAPPIQPQDQGTGDFEKEPFVGMWRDREDLADSSAWVRDTRRAEWDRTGR